MRACACLAVAMLWSASGVAQTPPPGWAFDDKWMRSGTALYISPSGDEMQVQTAKPFDDGVLAHIQSKLEGVYRNDEVLSPPRRLASPEGEMAHVRMRKSRPDRQGRRIMDYFVYKPASGRPSTAYLYAQDGRPLTADMETIVGAALRSNTLEPSSVTGEDVLAEAFNDLRRSDDPKVQADLRRLEDMLKSSTEAGGTRKEAPKPKTERQRKREAKLAALTLGPRERQSPRLAGVLYTWGLDYAGTFANYDEDVTAIFSDGTAVFDPPVRADRLDLSAARELEPRKIRQWKRQGGNYVFRKSDDDEWRTRDDQIAFLSSPPRKGTRIDGRFTRVSTGGSIAFGANTSSGSLTLRQDGTFETASSSMMGSSYDLGGLGSATVFSHCGPDGGSSSTSVSGGGLVGGGSQRLGQCGDGNAGRYEVDGFSVTLHRNNGTSETLPFYMTDNSVMLGSQHFSKGKPK